MHRAHFVTINEVSVVLNRSLFVRYLCKCRNGYRRAFSHAPMSTSASATHYGRQNSDFRAVPQPDGSHTAKVANVNSKVK